MPANKGESIFSAFSACSAAKDFPLDGSQTKRVGEFSQRRATDDGRPMTKTNAARLLDQLNITYELREYAVDPDDLAAETVAAKIGLPPEQVFKTLVARGDRNGICMAVIPGDQELNLKKLATAAGERKIELVPVKELQNLTGYIRGGVTALAAKKDYPVFVDETIELFDVISISAGMRGLQILLKPEDYLRATKAKLADPTQPKKS